MERNQKHKRTEEEIIGKRNKEENRDINEK